MEATTLEAIDSPATVLLVQSSRQASGACPALRDDDGGATLVVTVDEERIEQPYPAPDETLGILVIGDVLTASSDGFDDTGPIVTDAIADPTDLAAIGVAISRFCERWADEPLTVCFDSLDALLGHTSPTDVFQFIHVLSARLSNVDACAHVHFDPTHHEDRLVSTFGTVFDDVITDSETRDSLSEATDDEIATLLAEWDDQSSTDADRSSGSVTEATDDEIATLLGERSERDPEHREQND